MAADRRPSHCISAISGSNMDDLVYAVSESTRILRKRTNGKSGLSNEEDGSMPIAKRRRISKSSGANNRPEKLVYCKHLAVEGECHNCGKDEQVAESYRESERRRRAAKGGDGVCDHGHTIANCPECSYTRFCAHKKVRSLCTKCNPKIVCEHDSVRVKMPNLLRTLPSRCEKVVVPGLWSWRSSYTCLQLAQAGAMHEVRQQGSCKKTV